jgi:antitoxin component YwqK of YwqJK toxin-antitoxin module
MEHKFGFFKHGRYIIEIENLVKSRLNWNIIIPDYATYRTTKFKVISISDMVDDSKHDRIKYIKEYKVDKIYKREELYFKLKDLAIYDDKFIANSQWKLFPNGVSGVYRTYHVGGQLEKEYFHINGLIEGKYVFYYENGQIDAEANYINGKIEGEYKRHYDNGNILLIYNHLNGEFHGDLIEYNSDGLLISQCKYKNGILHGSYIEYDHENKKYIITIYNNGLKEEYN